MARLCRTLDGIPLAIELAAARIRALSAEQIADRLGDRFQLLASGDRTAPVRQQTLRAAVDWSYELLTEPEQALLRRLSVFSGWNLEMAEQVCADEQIPADEVLDLLAALIDKSLVSAGRRAGRGRPLPAAGHHQASTPPAGWPPPASRPRSGPRTATTCSRLAEGVVARGFLRGDPPWPERVAMYLRIDAERPNFRAALAECAEPRRGREGPAAVQRAAQRLGGLRRRHRGRRLVRPVPGCACVRRGRTRPRARPIRARALVHRAELAFEQQDYDAAARCAQAGLDLLDSPSDGAAAGALRMLGPGQPAPRPPDDALTSVDAAARRPARPADWR